MRLCVPTSTAKDVGHFSLGSREVVRINFKLILQLKLQVTSLRTLKELIIVRQNSLLATILNLKNNLIPILKPQH